MKDAGTPEAEIENVQIQARKKRSNDKGVLEPVFAVCTCEESSECQVETDEVGLCTPPSSILSSSKRESQQYRKRTRTCVFVPSTG